MFVDLSCKPSRRAFCVWDSLHAAAGRIGLHISKLLAELGLATMEFLQRMALCIEQHDIFDTFCLIPRYSKKAWYVYIYIYTHDFVRCNASTQNPVMLAMSLEMAIPAIPAIPADARSVSARASVGWSRLRRGGRAWRWEQLGDGVGPYWNLGP